MPTITDRLFPGLLSRTLWIAVILLMGCERPGEVVVGSDMRVSDGLLERPDLQLLVERQEARDAGALVSALAHDDAAVRARSAFALGSVQARSAAPLLIEALEAPESTVRADAAFALGQLTPAPQGVEGALLRRLTVESDGTVRRTVMEALGKVGGAEAASVLSGLIDRASPGAPTTLALARLLVRGFAPEGSVVSLAGHLDDGDPAVREAAAWGFATSPPRSWQPAREVVDRALDGYALDDHAAAYLLRAMGATGDPAEIPRIAAWSERATDWRIRVAAAGALAASGAEEGRAALLVALDDASAHVRVAAASALAQTDLTGTDVDRMLDWVRTHPDDRYTAGALMSAIAAAGRGAEVLAWMRGLPAGQEIPRRRGIEALALVSGADAVRTLADAAASDSHVLSGTALRVLALRWEDDRAVPSLRPLYLEAFASVLREGDPVTAAMAAALLSDPLFAPLGAGTLLSAEGASSPPPVVEVPTLDWAFLNELGPRPHLVLDTERGEVVLELATEQAPLTVQVLAQLAATGRFDGVPFHRVVPDFVIQGGDVERGDGTGEPDFRLVSEFTRLGFRRGSVGMASTGKDTENSQYFIMHSLQPFLDGGYTAFGTVVEGQEVVDRILEGERVVRASIRPTVTGR